MTLELNFDGDSRVFASVHTNYNRAQAVELMEKALCIPVLLPHLFYTPTTLGPATSKFWILHCPEPFFQYKDLTFTVSLKTVPSAFEFMIHAVELPDSRRAVHSTSVSFVDLLTAHEVSIKHEGQADLKFARRSLYVIS